MGPGDDSGGGGIDPGGGGSGDQFGGPNRRLKETSKFIFKQSNKEKIALRQTLDKLQIEINTFVKRGAKDVPIKNQTIIEDLSKALQINTHGLQEIKLNMSQMQVSGSSSFKERVEEIFTEYKLSINKNKFI